jgi:hypothetical protein
MVVTDQTVTLHHEWLIDVRDVTNRIVRDSGLELVHTCTHLPRRSSVKMIPELHRARRATGQVASEQGARREVGRARPGGSQDERLTLGRRSSLVDSLDVVSEVFHDDVPLDREFRGQMTRVLCQVGAQHDELANRLCS